MPSKPLTRGGKISTTGAHSYDRMHKVFDYTKAFIKKMRSAILGTEGLEKRSTDVVKARDFNYLKHLIRQLDNAYYYICRHETMGTKSARMIKSKYNKNTPNRTTDDIVSDDARCLEELIELSNVLKQGYTIEEPRGRPMSLTLYRKELIEFMNKHKVSDDQPDIKLVEGNLGGYLSVHNTIQYWYAYLNTKGLIHREYPGYIDYEKNSKDPLMQLLSAEGLDLAGDKQGKSALDIASLPHTKTKGGEIISDPGFDYRGVTNVIVVRKVKGRKGEAAKEEKKKTPVRGILPKTEGMRIMALFVLKNTVAPTPSESTVKNIERLGEFFKKIKFAKEEEEEAARVARKERRNEETNRKTTERQSKQNAKRIKKQQNEIKNIKSKMSARSAASGSSRASPRASPNKGKGKAKKDNNAHVSRSRTQRTASSPSPSRSRSRSVSSTEQ